jgi:hypothetical protein
MRLAPEWASNDASMMDMVRLLGPAQGPTVFPAAAKRDRYADLREKHGEGSARFQLARATYARRYIQQQVTFPRWATMVARALGRGPRRGALQDRQRAFYTFRECLAVTRVLEVDSDTVVIWHPLHVAAIGGMLVANGYVPQEPEWVTACHDVKMIIPPSARAQRRAANKAGKQLAKAGQNGHDETARAE